MTQQEREAYIAQIHKLNAQMGEVAETIHGFIALGASSGLIGSALGSLVGVQTTLAFALPPLFFLIPVFDEASSLRATINVVSADNDTETPQTGGN